MYLDEIRLFQLFTSPLLSLKVYVQHCYCAL
jgi:hypothetical protein